MKRSLVEKHRQLYKGNMYLIALGIYDDLVAMNYTEQDLIDVFAELESKGLDTSCLTAITKKSLYCNRDGYYLKDASEVECLSESFLSSLRAEKDIKHQKLVKECNSKSDIVKSLATDLYDKKTAVSILTTYKNKYNINDAMWDKELKRLEALCSSTNIFVVADFVKNNFL